MRLKRVNDEVFYTDSDKVTLDYQNIAGLVNVAASNRRKRARICTHPDIGHNLHEMMIVHHRGVYVRPHYHSHKTESFHILHGDADIVLFADDGRICDVVSVGAYGSGKVFYCRFPEKCYHSLLVSSDIFIVHEITGGPFKKEQTFFPEWAPCEDDEAGAEKYLQQNIRMAESFKENAGHGERR